MPRGSSATRRCIWAGESRLVWAVDSGIMDGAFCSLPSFGFGLNGLAKLFSAISFSIKSGRNGLKQRRRFQAKAALSLLTDATNACLRNAECGRPRPLQRSFDGQLSVISSGLATRTRLRPRTGALRQCALLVLRIRLGSYGAVGPPIGNRTTSHGKSSVR